MPTRVWCRDCGHLLYYHAGIPEEYRTRHSTLPEIVWKLHDGKCPMCNRKIPNGGEWKHKMTFKVEPVQMTKQELAASRLRHHPHILSRAKRQLRT
jgi:hypothetical protein